MQTEPKDDLSAKVDLLLTIGRLQAKAQKDDFFHVAYDEISGEAYSFLEREGLVATLEGSHDSRSEEGEVRCRLTQKGERIYQAAEKAYQPLLEKMGIHLGRSTRTDIRAARAYR